jgi:hypothetical protein
VRERIDDHVLVLFDADYRLAVRREVSPNDGVRIRRKFDAGLLRKKEQQSENSFHEDL